MTRRRLTPAGVAQPPFPGALAVQAGDMIFLGGVMATDWSTGIKEDGKGNPDFPHENWPMTDQTHSIYHTLDALLKEGGSGVQHMVRIDQFPTDWNMVRHYLPVRDVYIPEQRPASTCVAIKDLLVADATMQVDGIAIVPKDGFTNVAINNPKAPMPRGGYSLAIKAGDWIWCAGASPTDFVSRAPYPGGPGHTQPEDVMVDPNFWYGSEIKNQTRYVLHKLQLYLEAAGSDLKDSVKAHVYLTDTRNYPGFCEVWKETFGDNPPATTVVPINRMGIGGSVVEINLIALDSNSKLKREVINVPGVPQSKAPAPHAVKVGPYVFLSGRQAITDSGIDPRAKKNAAIPHLGSPGRDELSVVLEHTAKIMEAAGGKLTDVVRTQIFFTDLSQFGAAMGPWSDAFSDDPPALTAIGVTGPHIVPGLDLAVDVIGYVQED